MTQFDQLKAEDRTWAMWCHLSSLAWILLLLFAIPLPFVIANLIGPLICWLAKKDDSAFIDAHGRESLNFQISMTLYGFIFIGLLIVVAFFLLLSGVLAADSGNVLGFIITGFGFIGLLIIGVLFGVFQLALAIYAGIKAKQGQMYRYPLTLRFL
jgi:uncharacterized Tic20 family protein